MIDKVSFKGHHIKFLADGSMQSRQTSEAFDKRVLKYILEQPKDSFQRVSDNGGLGITAKSLGRNTVMTYPYMDTVEVVANSKKDGILYTKWSGGWGNLAQMRREVYEHLKSLG